jgi:hypothetical protein
LLRSIRVLLVAGLCLVAGALVPSTAQAATTMSLLDAVHSISAQSQGRASTQAICQPNVVIQSAGNGMFVTAELGYSNGDYAMLRARSGSIGPWELFTLCYDGRFYWFVSQANNGIVAAELGYSGGDASMLRARSTSVGVWEHFFILDQINFVVIRSAANSKFVSAELGYSGSSYAELRARANTFGAWESFL